MLLENRLQVSISRKFRHSLEISPFFTKALILFIATRNETLPSDYHLLQIASETLSGERKSI